jgi:hypothetical protein
MNAPQLWRRKWPEHQQFLINSHLGKIVNSCEATPGATTHSKEQQPALASISHANLFGNQAASNSQQHQIMQFTRLCIHKSATAIVIHFPSIQQLHQT